MENVLQYFKIGESDGGSQDWFTDFWMKRGGCAALTAVDSCLYLTREKQLTGLCPVDAYALTEESYVQFGMIMKPYISPRPMGVHKLEMYTEGFEQYLRERNCSAVEMERYPMGTPTAEAAERIRGQIDAGLPVPMLHLRPKTPRVDDYEWHWFLLIGCRDADSGLEVRTVTYGVCEWVPLQDLWHETDAANGGLILYRLQA